MGKKNRRQHGRRSNNTAGSNGMQKVTNWNLQDAVPILIGPQLFNPDLPVRVEIAAGVNRWSYSVR